jgi:hypothetical protein
MLLQPRPWPEPAAFVRRPLRLRFGSRACLLAACPSKVQHWQLRDLVSFDAHARCIYTVSGSTVMEFNPRTKQVRLAPLPAM